MTQTFRSVTCLGCGCACDDIDVVIEDGRIADARRACDRGARWFSQAAVSQPPRINGRIATADEVLDATAALLKRASAPLIYLAPDLSCDAQREAVALADALGAVIDSVSSAAPLAGILAAQEQGRVSATLGEIRNRADVLVFWATDPEMDYPRFRSRYAPDAPGIFLPEGRSSRRVVAVDIGERRGPADADVRIAVAPAEQEAVLALAGGLAIQGNVSGSSSSATHAAAAMLASATAAGRYVAVVVDGETTPDSAAPGLAPALTTFVQSLNDVTRAALCTLRAGGNRSGADAVLTWQTGFPVAVDFMRGYPEYRPYHGAASTHIDAALIVGAPAAMPPALRTRLFALPCIVLGPLADAEGIDHLLGTLDAGIAGIHESGLAYRMDDVPVNLRAVLDGPPLVPGLLRDLRRRCLAS